jgi:hypothetical protein
MSKEDRQDWEDWDPNKKKSSEASGGVETKETPTDQPEKGFWSRLSSGDFGLAKTYWLYGVLVGVIVNISSNAVTSADTLILLILAYAIYSVPVLMGIWNAASKYEGLQLWAILAKIATILGALMLAVMLLAVIGLMNRQSSDTAENTGGTRSNVQRPQTRTYTQQSKKEYSAPTESREQYNYDSTQQQTGSYRDYSTGYSYSGGGDKIESPTEDSDGVEVSNTGTIRKAQSMLSQLGYSAGTIDGIIGRKTRSAIRAFEKDMGRSQTGILTPTIIKKLYAKVSTNNATAPSYSENRYITGECEYKRIMTDQDYINCGLNPPSHF